MNDKFRRDERVGANQRRYDQSRDRYGDRYREDRYGEDRALRSPDREFETSQPYRQPNDEAWGYGSPDDERFYGRPSFDSRERSVGWRGAVQNQGYSPSPYVPDWQQRGGFYGRGPKGYTRSDERVREDVCERLSWNDEIDATDVSVRVESGEVTLEGTVPTRHMKRLATDVAEEVNGVQDVHNVVRVTKPLLTELKEKLTGEQSEEHHAYTGTKATSGGSGSAGLSHSRNGES